MPTKKTEPRDKDTGILWLRYPTLQGRGSEDLLADGRGANWVQWLEVGGRSVYTHENKINSHPYYSARGRPDWRHTGVGGGLAGGLLGTYHGIDAGKKLASHVVAK